MPWGFLLIGRGFVTGLVIFTAGMWTGWMFGRRRRRTLGIVLVVGSMSMTLLSGLTVANAHFAYLPRLGDVFGGHGQWHSAPAKLVLASSSTYPFGVVTRIPVVGRAARLGSPQSLVWLPPQYFSAPDDRFPAVYLMHGSPGAPVDWLRAAGAADAALASARDGHPTILVMPKVSRGWFDDSECVNGRHEKVESYVVHAVVRSVDAALRTRPDPTQRIIGGVSSGGFCALNLGLRHRDTWATILDLSGFDHPTHSGGMKALFGRRSDLSSVVARNTPGRYAGRVELGRCSHVWLDTGSRDRPALRSARSMLGLLRRGTSPPLLHVRPGGHTYGVWRPALAQALRWSIRVADRAPTSCSP